MDRLITTVAVQVTDNGGFTSVDQAAIDVLNVSPTAVLSNNGPVLSGNPVTVSFSDQVRSFDYRYNYGLPLCFRLRWQFAECGDLCQQRLQRLHRLHLQ